MRFTLLAALGLLLAAPAAYAQDYTADATYGEPYLEEGFTPDPQSISLTAGGGIRVNKSGCSYGYVANAPDVKLHYDTSGGSNLYIYAVADRDVTLLINTPSGRWVCNDDSFGNGDPILVFPGAEGGRYDIWVGTYGSDTAPARLYITEIDPR
ncbi:MAG TPA: hypothetical protein VD962_01280 [Rubricoccaceae bacterium]|nr:hypothetical protein [Rubricoccaceae bacterium]